MPQKKSWKNHKDFHHTLKVEADDFELCCSSIEKAKAQLEKGVNSIISNLEDLVRDHKLEDIYINSDIDTEKTYYNSDIVVWRVYLSGKKPMTEKEIAKEKEAANKRRAEKRLTKQQKEMEERMEYERLKRKFETQ